MAEGWDVSAASFEAVGHLEQTENFKNHTVIRASQFLRKVAIFMSFSPEVLAGCWFLTGPTASGKTAASLELADKLNAEIIALDSMTLYRGMDIGTAKPSAREQQLIPHHLIDVLDPHEEYSLADYIGAAELACQEIMSRGRVPLFVGGTGLYLRGLLRGVFAGPAADWETRRRLEQTAMREGALALWEHLNRVDPVSANRLHPNDQRRIIRAIEVFELTGQPLSLLQTQGVRPTDQQPRHVYWLSSPREWLHHRINVRVEQMFQEGLVDEVKRLMQGPLGISHTARQALGYKEVIDWIEGGPERPISASSRPPVNQSKPTEDLIQTIQTRTRQFAKRQETWFRNLEECHPVVIDGTENPAEIAQLLLTQ